LYTLARLEETALSTWLRESGVGFFSSLTLHSLAMALVVGINVVLALRLLAAGPAPHLPAWRPVLRLHWLGAGLILLSGLALLLAYPAKALTNWVFYLKLLALVAAWLMVYRLQHRGWFTGGRWRRPAAAALLGLWLLVIFAGRFLAYTNNVLLASRFY